MPKLDVVEFSTANIETESVVGNAERRKRRAWELKDIACFPNHLRQYSGLVVGLNQLRVIQHLRLCAVRTTECGYRPRWISNTRARPTTRLSWFLVRAPAGKRRPRRRTA